MSLSNKSYYFLASYMHGCPLHVISLSPAPLATVLDLSERGMKWMTRSTIAVRYHIISVTIVNDISDWFTCMPLTTRRTHWSEPLFKCFRLCPCIMQAGPFQDLLQFTLTPVTQWLGTWNNILWKWDMRFMVWWQKSFKCCGRVRGKRSYVRYLSLKV